MVSRHHTLLQEFDAPQQLFSSNQAAREVNADNAILSDAFLAEDAVILAGRIVKRCG